MKKLLLTVIMLVLMPINVHAAESVSVDYCQRVTYEDGSNVTECDLLTEDAIVPIAINDSAHSGAIDQLRHNTFIQDGNLIHYQRLEYCDYTQSYRLYCLGKQAEYYSRDSTNYLLSH